MTTINDIIDLVNKYPNDAELGKEVRLAINKKLEFVVELKSKLANTVHSKDFAEIAIQNNKTRKGKTK